MRTASSVAPAPRVAHRWPSLAGAVLAGSVLVGLLTGCGGSDTSAPSTSEGVPVPNAAQEFQRKCEEGVTSWREGQVSYPRTMKIALNETVPYEAAVDIGENPLPADEVIETESGSAASERVFVRCRLAAKLTALSEGLDVSQDPEAEGTGWVYQEFTPSGVVEWSWAVTATEPGDQRLRLDLRPSLQVNELPSYSTANQVSFTTDVTVDASPIQLMWHWIQTQWPMIVGIATPLGAAILALLAWFQKVRASTRTPEPAPPTSASDPTAQRSAAPGPPTPGPPTPGPPAPGPPTPGRWYPPAPPQAPSGTAGPAPGPLDQPDSGRAQPGGSP